MTQGHLARRFRIPSVFTNNPARPFYRCLGSRFPLVICKPMQLLATPTPLCIMNLVFSTGFLSHFVLFRSLRRLLVVANVVPSSPILVTLITVGLISSETSVHTRTTFRKFPEDAIIQIRYCSLQHFLLFSNVGKYARTGQ
jgi:amino acid transporter